MKILREVYDFITGGSALTPIGLAAAIVAALFLHAWRPEAFVAIIALTFIASTFEKPT